MSASREITYPRYPVKLTQLNETDAHKKAHREILKFKQSKAYKRYCENVDIIFREQENSIQFTCVRCDFKEKTINIPLYEYISYSNTADEDRYDDYAVFCPKCHQCHSIDRNNRTKHWKEIITN